MINLSINVITSSEYVFYKNKFYLTKNAAKIVLSPYKNDNKLGKEKGFGQMTIFLKENAGYLKKNLLWMKTMHYLNTIGSHLVTIVPMEPFTPKSTSKLRSALHVRYSIVIPRFISRTNTAQS